MSLTEIQHHTGRILALERFYQRETYANTLIGGPNKKLNTYIIAQLCGYDAERVMDGRSAILIEPDVCQEDGEECLPRLACLGEFRSWVDDSGLILLWFQDEEGIYISETNRTKIVEVKWAEFAFRIED